MRRPHLSPRCHAGADPEASGPYPRPVASTGTLVRTLAGQAAWESAALAVAGLVAGTVIGLVLGRSHEHPALTGLSAFLTVVILIHIAWCAAEAGRVAAFLTAGASRRRMALAALATAGARATALLPYPVVLLAAAALAGPDGLGQEVARQLEPPARLWMIVPAFWVAACGLGALSLCLVLAWRRWGGYVVPVVAAAGIAALIVGELATAEPGPTGTVARVISLFIPMPSILLTPATNPATSAGWALVTGPLTLWLLLRRWEPVR